MTEKQARDRVDERVLQTVRSTEVCRASDVESALQFDDAAKELVAPLRPMARVVDQSLQRLRRRGAILFTKDGGWKSTGGAR